MKQSTDQSTDANQASGPGLTSSARSSILVTPVAVRPFPVAARVLSGLVKKRKTGRATLLTSSPFKAELLSKLADKAKKPTQQRKSVVSNVSERSAKQKKVEESNDRKKQTNKKPVCRVTNSSNSTDACVSCGFIYGDIDDPLIDDEWYTCSKCVKWSHESCGVSRQKKFFCNRCL